MANDPFKEDPHEPRFDDNHPIRRGSHHRHYLFRQAERATQKAPPPGVDNLSLPLIAFAGKGRGSMPLPEGGGLPWR